MQAADWQVVTSAPLPYVLSIPSVPSGRLWPVLCFLHGYGEAAPVELLAGCRRHGPLAAGSAAVARERFLVVAPQLPYQGDVWHRHADAVEQILITLWEAHGGDPLRSYLSGFSYGANGVFDLGLAQRDFWAALWAVDPTRVPPRDPLTPTWLSIGEAARPLAPQLVERLQLEPAAATPAGHGLYLDQGLDHVATAREAYADGRIYRWLLQQALPGDV